VRSNLTGVSFIEGDVGDSKYKELIDKSSHLFTFDARLGEETHARLLPMIAASPFSVFVSFRKDRVEKYGNGAFRLRHKFKNMKMCGSGSSFTAYFYTRSENSMERESPHDDVDWSPKHLDSSSSSSSFESSSSSSPSSTSSLSSSSSSSPDDDASSSFSLTPAVSLKLSDLISQLGPASLVGVKYGGVRTKFQVREFAKTVDISCEEQPFESCDEEDDQDLEKRPQKGRQRFKGKSNNDDDDDEDDDDYIYK
jgi:hypothetical protein